MKLPSSLELIFHRPRAEREMEEELRSHLQIRADDLERQGLSRLEAERQARVEFGGYERYKEECRDALGSRLLGEVIADVRHGVRILAKNRGFTVVAIVTLALGIGANTAIFSVVNAVLLRPLPYKDADQLVDLWETNLTSRTSQLPVSYPDFYDWRSQNQVFQSMAVHSYATFTLMGTKEPIHMEGRVVTADFFSVLGTQPALGRSFVAEDDKPGHHVVVLSHDLWKRSFNSDPKVLGQTIELDRTSFTVVGVMPAGFEFPIQAKPVEIWAAMGLAREVPTERGNYSLEVIARLRPQITIESARAAMGTIAARLDKEYHTNTGVKLIPEHQQRVREVRSAMLVLFGAVVLVLLIACVNVANLLLAQGTNREREIAVRAAIGAGRSRIVRQLLAESMILSFSGGALGMLLAFGIVRLLMRFGPQDIPRLSEVGLDSRVFFFSLMVILATGLIFGLAPALRTARVDLMQSLKASGVVAQGGPRRPKLRAALVVSEVALTLLLLTGAGLMVNSLFRLMTINPGFNPSGVVTFAVDLVDADYTGAQLGPRFGELLERIKQSPGVESAAADTCLPLSGTETMYTGVKLEGVPAGNSQWVAMSIVTPDLFRTLNIPLLTGRDFTIRDDMKAPQVVVVSQSFVRAHFPNQNGLGKRITTGINDGDGRPLREIVGVVGDIRRDNLTDKPAAAIYLPVGQIPAETIRFVVRSRVPVKACVDSIRTAVRSVGKNIPLYDIKTLDQYVGVSVAQSRFNTMLLATFAAVATLLSVVGLYGVISYMVARRTHEFGIRLALGANCGDIVRRVLGEGIRLAAVGIVVGVVGAFALTRFLSSQLYGVEPADPCTFITVSALFAGIALIASYLPARHATKVNPMEALRYE